MTVDEFEQLVARARAEDPSSDYGTVLPATPAQVAAAEQALGVTFPPEYVEFVRRYGGGEFGLGAVYSVAPGEWSVVERNSDHYLPLAGFVAVAPNDMGDYYGFEHVCGRCGSQVRFLDHETESLAGPDVAQPYDDLFEFLRDSALDFVA